MRTTQPCSPWRAFCHDNILQRHGFSWLNVLAFNDENPTTRPRCESDSWFSIALICISRRRIPAGASINQGPEKGDVSAGCTVEDWDACTLRALFGDAVPSHSSRGQSRTCCSGYEILRHQDDLGPVVGFKVLGGSTLNVGRSAILVQRQQH